MKPGMRLVVKLGSLVLVLLAALSAGSAWAQSATPRAERRDRKSVV